MSEKDNGGPAFPVTYEDGFTDKGMTMRDWFAGMADVSKVEISNIEHGEEVVGRPCPRSGSLDQLKWQADLIAIIRGALADAMLAERAKA